MTTQPPKKEAGVKKEEGRIPGLQRGENAPLQTTYQNRDTGNTFTISYKTTSGQNKKFHFAMLPAIEAQLQYGPSSNMKGNAAVPEVKPGIVTNTQMRYKNFLVPGGAPVVQTIGINSTTHQLVGAFIGTEGDKEDKDRLNNIYRIKDQTGEPPYTNQKNAVTAASYFDAQVVQSGRPVNIQIVSDVIYTYEGVILNFKFYAVRGDRAYYVMDLLATQYPSLMSNHKQ